MAVHVHLLIHVPADLVMVNESKVPIPLRNNFVTQKTPRSSATTNALNRPRATLIRVQLNARLTSAKVAIA